MRMIARLPRILSLFTVTLLFVSEIQAQSRRSNSINLFEEPHANQSGQLPAFRPLSNPLRSLSAGASAGAAVSAAGHSAPVGLPFWVLSLQNPDAEYVLFVESRESIKKDFLVSGRLRHPLLELDAGYRWMPGPRTAFLGDPDARSGFSTLNDTNREDQPGIPDGRRYHSTFARIPLGPWMPGAFNLRSDTENDTGFYFASDNWLLAIGRQRGVLTLHGPVPIPFSDKSAYGFVDLRRTREIRTLAFMVPPESAPAPEVTQNQVYTTHAGYGRLVADKTPETFFAVGEVERRASRDYADYSNRRLAPDRSGRSGLATLSLRIFDWLEPAIAGEDRGQDGFRMAELVFAPQISSLIPDTGWPGRFLIRGRSYRKSRYGKDAAADAPEIHDKSRLRFSAGGLGYRWHRNGGGFEILGETRRHGGRTIELQMHLGPGLRKHTRETERDAGDSGSDVVTVESDSRWLFTAALVYGRLTPGEFLFLRAPAEQGAGVRFFGEETGALVLRLRSELFVLYLESRIEFATGRASTFANFQFRVRF